MLVLKSFDFRFNLLPEAESHSSMLAAFSGMFAPLMAPLGLGDWRIVSSLISGFMAKESVVSVLQVLFNEQGGVTAAMSPLSAAALLVFSLLYTPCVAAVASVKSELGVKWAVYLVIWQCAVAWFAAWLIRMVGVLAGF